jgi:16S rRNA (uracil1498-N3)-methyltransferase
MRGVVVVKPLKPLRVPVEGLVPGPLRLSGEAAHYVLRVHRQAPGAALLLFDPLAALEGEATLLHADKGGALCELASVRPSAYRAHPIELVQAVGKGDKPERIIRDATALGVAAITLVQTERTVVKLDAERAEARRERWQRVAVDAARQCERGDVPRIVGPAPLHEALASLRASQRLVLAPGALPLVDRLSVWARSAQLAFLVGPEGGLSEAELESARELGFDAVSLGGTILRTELAGIAALGALVAWLEGSAP